jgi:transcriptional regulator with XRE-family HTH domain
MTNIPSFIKQLAQERYRQRVTQATIAQRMGVTQCQVAHYENGLRQLETFQRLERWADALGLELTVRRKTP